MIPKIDDPVRAEVYQWLFYLNATLQPELMIYFYPNKHTTALGGADAISEAQETRIAEMFNFLDKQLEDKYYLVGNSFTVCDCFLFMLSHWASGFKKPPLSFSNLTRYLCEIAKRQAVINVCKAEGTSLDAYR